MALADIAYGLGGIAQGWGDVRDLRRLALQEDAESRRADRETRLMAGLEARQRQDELENYLKIASQYGPQTASQFFPRLPVTPEMTQTAEQMRSASTGLAEAATTGDFSKIDTRNPHAAQMLLKNAPLMTDWRERAKESRSRADMAARAQAIEADVSQSGVGGDQLTQTPLVRRAIRGLHTGSTEGEKALGAEQAAQAKYTRDLGLARAKAQAGPRPGTSMAERMVAAEGITPDMPGYVQRVNEAQARLRSLNDYEMARRAVGERAAQDPRHPQPGTPGFDTAVMNQYNSQKIVTVPDVGVTTKSEVLGGAPAGPAGPPQMPGVIRRPGFIGREKAPESGERKDIGDMSSAIGSADQMLTQMEQNSKLGESFGTLTTNPVGRVLQRGGEALPQGIRDFSQQTPGVPQLGYTPEERQFRAQAKAVVNRAKTELIGKQQTIRELEGLADMLPDPDMADRQQFISRMKAFKSELGRRLAGRVDILDALGMRVPGAGERTPRPPAAAAPTSRIRVTAPDGKPGSWPADQPLPPGFKRAQ